MITVEVRTLDAIAHEMTIDRLDFVKIDVEGFEWSALCGGEQTMRSRATGERLLGFSVYSLLESLCATLTHQ